jgi:hypothetical protein
VRSAKDSISRSFSRVVGEAGIAPSQEPVAKGGDMHYLTGLVFIEISRARGDALDLEPRRGYSTERRSRRNFRASARAHDPDSERQEER